MKSQKLIAYVLITIIICATLAVSRQIQKKNEPIDVKELHLRITKLESKVTQLERTIEEMQKPRAIPLNQK